MYVSTEGLERATDLLTYFGLTLKNFRDANELFSFKDFASRIMRGIQDQETAGKGGKERDAIGSRGQRFSGKAYLTYIYHLAATYIRTVSSVSEQMQIHPYLDAIL